MKRPLRKPARPQRGVTILVVLVLLSVMLLGGLAMARMTEIGTLAAGNAAYRAALAGPRAQRTRVSPAISGRPARGIENAFMQRADEARIAGYPYAYDLGKALNAAASAQGDDGYAPQWAGQAAPLSRALPAAELVSVLKREMREAIAGLPRP